MKKKAGQAQEGASRSSSVRNTSLAPAYNNSDKNLAVSKSEAPKSMAPEAPAMQEFDYSSLGKIGLEKPKKTLIKKPSSSGSAKKSNTVKTEKTPKTAKAKKTDKNRKSMAPVLAAVLGVIIIISGILIGLYYAGFFKPKIEVTLADGTVKEMRAEAAYAELMTDRFYQGTIIDGIDVSGMTRDEAIAAVSATLPEKPLNVDIRLDLTTIVIPVDFSDAGFAYNTEEIVDQAFNNFRPTDENDLAQIIECYNGVQQLKNVPQEYQTAYTVKIEGVSQKIHSVLDPLYDEYARVEDAKITDFDTDECEFIVTPEKIGYEMDIDATVTNVKALFDSKTYTGLVKVPMNEKQPAVTEKMIKEEFGLIGSEWTNASGNTNRNVNINQACENICGTILNPNETFSFNTVVGQRTAENGFREATVILGGQYEQGFGGGICQVSTTLYNAVLKSNLEIVERYSHAWPSDYISAGLDATVDWPNLDFKFKNDSENQIVVVAYFDWSDNTVHAEIYGKKLPDGKSIEMETEVISTVSPGANEYVEDPELPVGQTKTIRAAHTGMTVKVYKVWYDKDDNEIDRYEYGTTTYSAFGTRIGVGTLNPDGSHATFDKKTGEITSPIMTVTPTPTPTPEPATPTPTPEPTQPPETSAETTPSETSSETTTPAPPETTPSSDTQPAT